MGMVCSFLFLLLVHILFSIPAPNKWLEAKWGAGDIISFSGTIALGIIAVWQTHEANQISKKMIQLEYRKTTPKINISSIKKDRYMSFDVNDIYKVELDNCYCHYNEHLSHWETDGDILYFCLQNTSECHIIELGINGIDTAVIYADNKRNLMSHSCSYSIYPNELTSTEKIPMLLVIPENMFTEMYGQGFDNPFLWISLNFHFMNEIGDNFVQKIDLYIDNAEKNDTMRPVIVRKILHPVCLLEEEV